MFMKHLLCAQSCFGVLNPSSFYSEVMENQLYLLPVLIPQDAPLYPPMTAAIYPVLKRNQASPELNNIQILTKSL